MRCRDRSHLEGRTTCGLRRRGGQGEKRKTDQPVRATWRPTGTGLATQTFCNKCPNNGPYLCTAPKGSLHQKAPSRINRQLILLVAEIHSHGKQSPALLLRRRIKSGGIKGTVRCQVTSARLSTENQRVLISPPLYKVLGWYRN